jgi:hypothetical protein
VLASSLANAQIIGESLPKPIDKSKLYLFYLHGGVVTRSGNNAINQSVPQWGPYQYLSILDSLQKRGFNVISENRKFDIDDTVYVKKIVSQVDSLLRKKVSPKNILVLGASAGSHIALLASAKLKNKKLNFVIMGGCWPETYKDYTGIDLFGNYLSIYEDSDPHQSCISIFSTRKTLTSSKEIKINTGLSHGFIYKGHKEWIDPIVEWLKSN